MSRSYRHTSISGNAGSRSEKSDNRASNQRLRFAVRVALRRDDEVMPDLREVSSTWAMAKDGRQWWPEFLGWKEQNR